MIVWFLSFILLTYHIDSYADAKPPLHPWTKSHVIIVYEPFNVL